MANRRRLAEIIVEMEKIGAEAAAILLKQNASGPCGRSDNPPEPARPRMSF